MQSQELVDIVKRPLSLLWVDQQLAADQSYDVKNKQLNFVNLTTNAGWSDEQTLSNCLVVLVRPGSHHTNGIIEVSALPYS